jgi:sugar phosphate isomerase/epimerase
MSPVISINTLCLPPGSLTAHVDTIARLGVSAIAPEREEIDACGAAAAARLLSDAGLSLALITHRAFGFITPEMARAQRERLKQTVDLAHALGCATLCMTTGGRGDLSWTEAAKCFAAEIAPCVEYAASAGVVLGLEPTSPLYADVSIAHRFSDTVILAERAGIEVGLDLFACWTDCDLEATVAATAASCRFVQVSDYVHGDRGLPCRAVPGDGAVPLDRVVRLLLANGYRGPFDLEIIGPRLQAEGYERGLLRGVARLTQAVEAATCAASW